MECYVIYIPWLRGVYQQYEMQALRYLPSASPWADIKGRGSDIADTHQEDMVHNYSIAYCNIKLHNCPPLLLGPFRLPPGSVLALKEDLSFKSPFPATFTKLDNSRVMAVVIGTILPHGLCLIGTCLSSSRSTREERTNISHVLSL